MIFCNFNKVIYLNPRFQHTTYQETRDSITCRGKPQMLTLALTPAHLLDHEPEPPWGPPTFSCPVSHSLLHSLREKWKDASPWFKSWLLALHTGEHITSTPWTARGCKIWLCLHLKLNHLHDPCSLGCSLISFHELSLSSFLPPGFYTCYPSTWKVLLLVFMWLVLKDSFPDRLT